MAGLVALLLLPLVAMALLISAMIASVLAALWLWDRALRREADRDAETIRQIEMDDELREILEEGNGR